MKKFYILLGFASLCLTQTFAQVTGQMLSEKTYPDNTRICYFETDKALSEQAKEFLQREIAENEKIMRLSFNNGSEPIAMFESYIDFTLDSMINFVNDNINILSASGAEVFSKLSNPQRPIQQNAQNDCMNIIKPSCTDNTYGVRFPAPVDILPGYGRIGCLNTTPNPAWFWMKIANPGNITIYLSSGYDVDFILWGPFSDYTAACAILDNCTTCSSHGPIYPNDTDPGYGGGYTIGNVVDCSYSARPVEYAHIPNAQTGQIYIFLITNYANRVTNISFNQVSGNGTTDCNVLDISGIRSNSPVCVGGTLNLYAPSIPNAVTYNWTGPNGWTSNQQNPIITNVTTANAGVYKCFVSDGVNQSQERTTTVVINSPSDTTFINATICRGGRYEFPENTGIYRTEQGSYNLVLSNIHGCDSVITLNLFLDSCYVTFDELDAICADDQSFFVNYNIFGGTVNCVSAVFPPEMNWDFQDVVPCINPTKNTFEIPIPASTKTPPSYVRPDHYYVNLVFDYTDNSRIIKKLDFTVLYPSWIIEQKWNDVLALLNQYYNGGYAFSAYEWYKDNVKINNANGSYIYLGEENFFNYKSEYRVKVTRTDDNTSIFTCAYSPYDRSDLECCPLPSIVDGNSTVYIKAKEPGTITFISVSGIVISKQKLSFGENPVQTPTQSGFYIMVIESKNQPPTKQVLLVR